MASKRAAKIMAGLKNPGNAGASGFTPPQAKPGHGTYTIADQAYQQPAPDTSPPTDPAAKSWRIPPDPEQ